MLFLPKFFICLRFRKTGIACKGHKKRLGVVSSPAIHPLLCALFAQGTLYNLAIELLQSRSLRPVLSGHFLVHISIYSFLYKIILTQAVTIL